MSNKIIRNNKGDKIATISDDHSSYSGASFFDYDGPLWKAFLIGLISGAICYATYLGLYKLTVASVLWFICFATCILSFFVFFKYASHLFSKIIAPVLVPAIYLLLLGIICSALYLTVSRIVN